MAATLTRGERNRLLKDLRAAGGKVPKLGYCIGLPAAVATKWNRKVLCRSYFPATRKLFPNRTTDYYFAGARRQRRR